jgi:stage III sporulation protein AC
MVKGEQMDIGLILKVAGVGILVSAAAQILQKSGRDEQSTLVVIAGIIVVLIMLVGEIEKLFELVISVFGF